ncbi:hypothetical protein [Helicobacter bilis]|uniref:Uncharacterized protein n=1 Tax=Helicobacter bilis TaxID=37372 RepID=A0A4U8U9S5_9HELI|nr:hypothetical protein [Helicobacter bilis]MCI7411952.1 hypothetical protein [Helicobacter bilis]MDD7296582.1 hypothetical protein [Helicobacter bilis]MDY4399436.1 hypothetical protein [Helicobacter bilis]TLE09031.1 hypothetical protein LS78_003580 [Helicobacter bilis]TLE11204.1 hypothetical protein LS79_003605 [Helicobacter bilis]
MLIFTSLKRELSVGTEVILRNLDSSGCCIAMKYLAIDSKKHLFYYVGMSEILFTLQKNKKLCLYIRFYTINIPSQ